MRGRPITRTGSSPGKPTVVRSSGGSQTWQFATTTPAPFLLVTVAPYEVLSGEQAVVYYFPSDSLGARRLLSATTKARRLYGQWFGPMDSAGPVTIMEIPEGWGSQASLAGGIIQTADAFRAGNNLPQLYHELAHLWHPKDLERPADRWNEGFATFLQWRVALEQADDSLRARMEEIARSVSATDAASRVPMDRYGEENQTDLAYRTGALLFYGLFQTLGAGAFDQCIGGFLQKYAIVGADNTAFVNSVGACHPTARRVLEDWFSSTRGPQRLRAGESLTTILSEYRQP